MAADVTALPAARRAVLENRFEAAARTILRHAPPRPAPGLDFVAAIGRWYAELDLTCPFLEDDLCTSYGERPIACREHMTLTPADLCEGFHPDRGEAALLGVSVLAALAALGAELDGGAMAAVPLPLALHWTRGFEDRPEPQRSATPMVERLLALLAAGVPEALEPAGVH
jgi:hypothetical protein